MRKHSKIASPMTCGAEITGAQADAATGRYSFCVSCRRCQPNGRKNPGVPYSVEGRFSKKQSPQTFEGRVNGKTKESLAETQTICEQRERI